jgi:two-component system cell cycle response regulator DivK
LVVEDNELNLKLFCDLLTAHDYTTEPVRDGREAVERARAFSPDLIVMDIQLPHVSGLELIETCKADEELKAIPIMAVTAYAGKEDEERVRAAGAEAYVSKPISLMRFVGEVAALTPRDFALVAEEDETEADATSDELALPEGDGDEEESGGTDPVDQATAADLEDEGDPAADEDSETPGDEAEPTAEDDKAEPESNPPASPEADDEKPT